MEEEELLEEVVKVTVNLEVIFAPILLFGEAQASSALD